MKTMGSAVSFESKVNQSKPKFSRCSGRAEGGRADERITAAVSHMDSLEKLKENIAAALNKTQLADADFQALEQYAAKRAMLIAPDASTSAARLCRRELKSAPRCAT